MKDFHVGLQKGFLRDGKPYSIIIPSEKIDMYEIMSSAASPFQEESCIRK